MEYCVDLDLEMLWILKDENYLDNLNLEESKLGHFYLPEENLTDEFHSWMESIGVHLWYSEIFQVPAHSTLFIHSDSLTPLDSCKINWVYDKGETFMRWYGLKNGAELKHQKNNIGGEYFACDDEDDYILKYQHKIGKPTLVNASEPHDVINNSDFPRWSVSLSFRKNGDDWRIGYNDFKNILQPWIMTT